MESLINNTLRTRLLYAGLALYLAIFIYGFLFLHKGGLGNRILNETWDLGHVLGFGVLIFFIIRLSSTCSRLPLVRQFVFASLFAISLGFCIEVIQLFTGRSFSLHDVFLNVVGAVTAVAFLSPNMSTVSYRLKLIIRLAAFSSLLFVSREVIIFSYDAYQANRQFPVLVDQSTPFELTRWRGHPVRYGIDEFNQTKVLKAEFLPAKYSTLVLDYFPRDWTGYQQMIIIIYSPGAQAEKLFIRLHDLAHIENDSHYTDRFNGELILEPGWNTFTLSLNAIQHAPRKRQMDMRHIHQLMLYFPHLTENKTLLIREIRLTD